MHKFNNECFTALCHQSIFKVCKCSFIFFREIPMMCSMKSLSDSLEFLWSKLLDNWPNLLVLSFQIAFWELTVMVLILMYTYQSNSSKPNDSCLQDTFLSCNFWWDKMQFFKLYFCDPSKESNLWMLPHLSGRVLWFSYCLLLYFQLFDHILLSLAPCQLLLFDQHWSATSSNPSIFLWPHTFQTSLPSLLSCQKIE